MDTGALERAVHRWRTPLAVAAAVVLVVLATLPFSGLVGPSVPELTDGWCAIVLLCDTVGVLLLVGLYRNGRGLRMLLLATAFAWSALTVLALAFYVRGLAGMDAWLGQGPTQGWLYLSRHLGPPLLIAAALAPWPPGWVERTRRPGRERRIAAWSCAAVLLVPTVVVLALMAAPESLPRIVDPDTGEFEPAVYAGVFLVNLAAVAVALLGVVRRSDRSSVEAWAVVAGVALLGDVLFVGVYDEGLTGAYYGSRLLALLASFIVPASILVDTWWVHQRLTAGTASLEAQVDQLLEGQRIRDHVAAVVSHDMRTPLAGLHGYLEVLTEEDDLDADLVRRMHERSLLLTRRLTLLTEDLLAATTQAYSDLVITPADLDLSEQLAECASGFPDLDLRIECPSHVHVHADPLRLQQILSNLVRNAEKHGAEPVVVGVTTDGADVTIRVEDAGEGVPATFIPRLFERYSQGARSSGGAGIGLSVVHDLVQAHHGTIRYDLTQPAFIVTLPVVAPPQPQPVGRVIAAPTLDHVTT